MNWFDVAGAMTTIKLSFPTKPNYGSISIDYCIRKTGHASQKLASEILNAKQIGLPIFHQRNRRPVANTNDLAGVCPVAACWNGIMALAGFLLGYERHCGMSAMR
jgi:hypothetical protein